MYKPYKGITLYLFILVVDGIYGNGLLSIASLILIILWATKGGGK